jgi:hypothetical protein
MVNRNLPRTKQRKVMKKIPVNLSEEDIKLIIRALNSIDVLSTYGILQQLEEELSTFKD